MSIACCSRFERTVGICRGMREDDPANEGFKPQVLEKLHILVDEKEKVQFFPHMKKLPSHLTRILTSTVATAFPLEERPGLGTQLGHELHDVRRTGWFFRKHPSLPDAVGRFFYNDEEGAQMMAELDQGKEPRKRKGSFELIPGRLRATVQGGGWSGADALPYYDTGKRVIVSGTSGQQDTSGSGGDRGWTRCA